jgi:hypothetical protein
VDPDNLRESSTEGIYNRGPKFKPDKGENVFHTKIVKICIFPLEIV